MEWKDVGNAAAAIAPTIAGVLTNVVAPGAGPLAAAGVQYLLRALGLGDDATPDEVNKALLSGDPEVQLKIRQADYEFQEHLKQLDVDLERVYAGDRDSARKMMIETKDRTPVVFGVLISLMFFAMLAALMFRVVPTENQNVFFSSLGVLGTVFTAFSTFLYGANKDTKLTTQLLAASSPPTGRVSTPGWEIRR